MPKSIDANRHIPALPRDAAIPVKYSRTVAAAVTFQAYERQCAVRLDTPFEVMANIITVCPDEEGRLAKARPIPIEYVEYSRGRTADRLYPAQLCSQPHRFVRHCRPRIDAVSQRQRRTEQHCQYGQPYEHLDKRHAAHLRTHQASPQ